jgi:peptidyl-prolyl cis-trans isomerase C
MDRWAWLTVACVCIGACAPQGDHRNFARVGNQTLSAGLRDYYIEQKTGTTPDKVDPAARKRLENDLIALAAAADSAANTSQPSVQQAVELSRLETLAQVAATRAGVDAAPTDQDVLQAYQAYVATLPKTEYHVAHILVATDPMALAVLQRLQHGEKFADVARVTSADESKDRGGDLGWVYPGHLPEAFMQAVQQLKVGEYTTEPVKTSYGWHIIKLLEKRPLTAPALDSVKAQLVVNMKDDRYRRFVANAVGRTNVQR